MNKENWLATVASGMLVVGAAFAADPPAATPVEALDLETVDPTMALERARELRKRVDEGDADAAWEFAQLIIYFNAFGPRADRERASEWRELQGRNPVSYWLNHAAELGSQPAIEGLCRMGNDPLAPAHLRERGNARCKELRRKYPAK